MTDQEKFAKKATSGYPLCFIERCPKKELCLRWKTGEQMPDKLVFCQLSINPRYQNVATEQCPLFRSAEKMKMAKGMTHIFTDDMPKRVEKYVRQELIAIHHRTYYYEYRCGSRLIPPVMQQEIIRLFREAGWQGEVRFDSYVDDYDWRW